MGRIKADEGLLIFARKMSPDPGLRRDDERWDWRSRQQQIRVTLILRIPNPESPIPAFLYPAYDDLANRSRSPTIQGTMTDTDTDWLVRARDGDSRAFRSLVETHTRHLYSLCARITRDSMIAEDAVQEALFNAWRHLSSFDGRAVFTTWLHRIAVNAALEQLRRRGRHDVVSDDSDCDTVFLDALAESVPGPDRHAAGREIQREAEHQLSTMSATERTAFVMRHHEGHSLEEISAVLALNTNACKQAIFRAVRKLRTALEPLR
jgi:RNA polymerase sigma-70 factor (ECF subfamily)